MTNMKIGFTNKTLLPLPYTLFFIPTTKTIRGMSKTFIQIYGNKLQTKT